MKLRRGLPRLRVRAAVAVLWACMARGRDRFGFRLCEFSIQGDHLHLIAEAADRRSLARGMQGLAVRCARRLNRLWGRKGTVFADRYHDHARGITGRRRSAAACPRPIPSPPRAGSTATARRRQRRHRSRSARPSPLAPGS
jgi:hypothetical protein